MKIGVWVAIPFMVVKIIWDGAIHILVFTFHTFSVNFCHLIFFKSFDSTTEFFSKQTILCTLKGRG